MYQWNFAYSSGILTGLNWKHDEKCLYGRKREFDATRFLRKYTHNRVFTGQDPGLGRTASSSDAYSDDLTSRQILNL